MHMSSPRGVQVEKRANTKARKGSGKQARERKQSLFKELCVVYFAEKQNLERE